MTVEELKQLLQDYPDDYRVAVITEESEEDLGYRDFLPLPRHDPAFSEEEKLLLLYLDAEEDH